MLDGLDWAILLDGCFAGSVVGAEVFEEDEGRFALKGHAGAQSMAALQSMQTHHAMLRA